MPASPSYRSLRRRRSLAGFAMALPAMFAVALFFFLPLVLMVWMALHNWPILGTPQLVGLRNFQRVFMDGQFWSAALFTLGYTAIVTPILFVVGLGLALLMRQQRPGVGIYRTIFFIPVVIGLAAASYLWVWLVQSGIGPLWNYAAALGLANRTTNWLASPGSALAVVIIMVVWKAVGLQMLLQMSGLQSIPSELDEAARIDGASFLQVLRYISIPLLRPTFALLMVFSVGGSLLAFDQFYIMTGGGPARATTTAVFSIYRSSFVFNQLGYGAALSFVLLIVLATVSALQFVIMPRQETHV